MTLKIFACIQLALALLTSLFSSIKDDGVCCMLSGLCYVLFMVSPAVLIGILFFCN